MKHFSKLGLWLAGSYSVMMGGFLYYAFHCSGEWCGFFAFYFLLPWQGIVNIMPVLKSVDDVYFVPVSFLLNATLLYFVGILIERFIAKIKNPESLWVFSKIGTWSALIYGITAGGISYYAVVCNVPVDCGGVILSVIWPWDFVPIPDVLIGPLGVFIAAFLNVIIIYFVGALIQLAIKKIKNRNNPLPLN